MGRKERKCQKKCTHHTFSLKPVHYSAYISRQTQISFCPSTLASPSITPKFNKDRRYFTASFTLPIDSKKLETNQEIYKVEHQRFKQEISEQKSKIRVPKPRSKNNYCNVCKDDFEDYLIHIGEQNHKKQLEKSKFNVYIEQICSSFVRQSQTKPLFQFLSKQDLNSDHCSFFNHSQKSIFCEKNANQYGDNAFDQSKFKKSIDLGTSTRSFQFISEGIDMRTDLLHQFNMTYNREDTNRSTNQIFFNMGSLSPMKRQAEANELPIILKMQKSIIINSTRK